MARDPVAAWAASGAMWLSRDADGAPLCAPGAPASLVATGLDELDVGLSGATVLGERAAIAALGPASSTSSGGGTRLLRTTDGHMALSLGRPGDGELVGALIERDTSADPWRAAADWATHQRSADAVGRAQLLGLPAAQVPGPGAGPDEQALARGGVRPAVVTPGAVRRHRRERPLVVDLSVLWAGPLCAHLLGLRGAVVVKVEGADRLDGARTGAADFYELLHAGHQSVTVDLRSPSGVEQLRRLMRQADLVIESSRPRALAQLGIDATEMVARGVTWLSITAYGRTGPWSNRVGLGDDVAAGAGMVARTAQGPSFLGDALADPLTGVFAARVAARALQAPDAQLLDVSMRDVVASTMGPMPEHEVRQTAPDTWEVATAHGVYAVEPPRPRTHPAAGRAPAPGEHNDRWLGAP